MFIVRPNTTPVKWPVKVSVPQDGGSVREYAFTAHFLILTEEEVQAFQDRGDKEYIEKILIGWGTDLVDEEQTPIPFSAEVRDALVNMTNVKLAIIQAYFDLIRGVKAKN